MDYFIVLEFLLQDTPESSESHHPDDPREFEHLIELNPQAPEANFSFGEKGFVGWIWHERAPESVDVDFQKLSMENTTPWYFSRLEDQFAQEVRSQKRVKFTLVPRAQREVYRVILVSNPVGESTGSESTGMSDLDVMTPSLVESAIDITAYPLWTREASLSTASRTGAIAASGTNALSQVAEGALRDILGWKPDAKKPDAFMSALTQSFALTEVEGHTEWIWTPKSYAVQTDMGAITGAQASIYNRATAAMDRCLPLLDGLHPLRADILPENLDSIRSVIRTQLTELVHEFGLLGGPRPHRVNQLFELLLGPQATSDPEKVTGTLSTLRVRLGLGRQRVNSIEDEQNLTNYLILVDYVIGLEQSWKNMLQATSQEPFLGTQLVLVSRCLNVVAEQVEEIVAAMDSMFLGAAERGAIPLRLTDGSRISVGDLLDWIAHIAGDEGPTLVRYSGKDGVVALTAVLKQLKELAAQALVKPVGNQEWDNVPPAYRSPRVQRSLQALVSQLDKAFNDALVITNPSL